MKLLIEPNPKSLATLVLDFPPPPFILKICLNTTEELLDKINCGLLVTTKVTNQRRLLTHTEIQNCTEHLGQHHILSEWAPASSEISSLLASHSELHVYKKKYKWKCVHKAANKCWGDWVHISHMVFLGKNNHYVILEPENMKFKFISKIWHLAYFCYHVVY